MSRPDVQTVPKLSLRANVETEIDNIVLSCGFEKIDIDTIFSEGKKKSWDRQIQLYVRKLE